MSWQPGLVTQIDDHGMSVKVSTGTDCAACPGKTECTFRGPESAYRTLRVARLEGCVVGDRLLVQEPGSVLAVALVVLVALPVALLSGGYALALCCVHFRYNALLLWLSGTALWIAGLYLANRWMSRASHFQTIVRQPVTMTEDRRQKELESRES